MGQRHPSLKTLGVAYENGKYLHTSVYEIESFLNGEPDTDEEFDNLELNNEDIKHLSEKLNECKRDWGVKDVPLPKNNYIDNYIELSFTPEEFGYASKAANFLSITSFRDFLDQMETFLSRLCYHGYNDMMYIIVGLYPDWRSLNVFLSPKFPKDETKRFCKLVGVKYIKYSDPGFDQAFRFMIFEVIYRIRFKENVDPAFPFRPMFPRCDGRRYLPVPEQNSRIGAMICGPILAIVGS